MASKNPGAKMGPWRKAPPSMVELFDEVLPQAPQVERRKMFGYPAGFANGHMFMGLFQEHMVLRLDTTDREAFLALPEAEQFEPMPGRPMREYVMATPTMLEDTDELRPWIQRSLGFVLSLPPKEAKAKATKAKETKAKSKTAATPAAKKSPPAANKRRSDV